MTPDLAGVFEPATLVVISMLAAAVAALSSGKLVIPRFIYDREKERADKAEAQIEKLAGILEDYNEQLRELRRG